MPGRRAIATNCSMAPAQPMKGIDPFETDDLLDDIDGRSLRGGALTLAAQGVKFALQLISTVFLARLLAPADFGLVAMVTAVTGCIALFKDAGLSLATVQRKEITRAQISTLFWANVAISLGLVAITLLLAPAIASLYSEPRLALITVVISSGFFLSGLSVQHQALLRRRMRFSALAIIDIVAMASGVAAALTVGLATGSYWALVAMPLTTAATTTVGVWIACPWLPSAPRRGTGVRTMLRFGGTVAACNLVNYVARNIDNVLTGWWLGAVALGHYSKAYSLLLLPIHQINAPFSSVMVPALSRLQHEPDGFRRLYMDTISLVAWLGMPPIMFLAIHAEAVILAVLGEQWLPAVPIFQLLAPAALMAATNIAGGWALIPLGRADKELRLALVTAPCFALAIAAGLPFGIVGVAIAVSVSRVLMKIPALAYCYAGTPLRIGDFLHAIAQPGIICIAMLVIDRVASAIALQPWLAALLEVTLATGAFLRSGAWRRLHQLIGVRLVAPVRANAAAASGLPLGEVARR